ncbi:hypothetical protein FRX31_012350, partial [Thalictrum thalictroides]
SSLVDKLIQRGYTVHAAIQDHGDLQALKGLNCNKLAGGFVFKNSRRGFGATGACIPPSN